LRATASKSLEDRRNQRTLLKFGAKSIDTVHLVEALLEDLIGRSVAESESPPVEDEDSNLVRAESPDEKSAFATTLPDSSAYLDPVDAAVR
jgi:hypothetical protein